MPGQSRHLSEPGERGAPSPQPPVSVPHPPPSSALAIAERIACATQPEQLDALLILLLDTQRRGSLTASAFWALWDALRTLRRVLPWTTRAHPTSLDLSRVGVAPARRLRQGTRAVVCVNPVVVWTLTADATPASGPAAQDPLTLLTFADGVLTVPSAHRYPVIEPTP